MASMIIVILCLSSVALSLIACNVDKRIKERINRRENGLPVLAKKTNFFVEMFQF